MPDLHLVAAALLGLLTGYWVYRVLGRGRRVVYLAIILAWALSFFFQAT